MVGEKTDVLLISSASTISSGKRRDRVFLGRTGSRGRGGTVIPFLRKLQVYETYQPARFLFFSGRGERGVKGNLSAGAARIQRA